MFVEMCVGDDVMKVLMYDVVLGVKLYGGMGECVLCVMGWFKCV